MEIRTKSKWQGIQLLRGFAIILVIAFHAFYGLMLINIPFFSISPLAFGFLGVQLFFMISGFVISNSLINAITLKGFLLRRYVRLGPALIYILPIIFLITLTLPRSPFKSESTFPNLLTSVSLISPEILNHFLGHNLRNISGVLWSLNAEVAFYLTSGFIFFLVRRSFFTFYCCMYATATIISGIRLLLGIGFNCHNLEIVNNFIIASRLQHLPWFCVGIWLYNKLFVDKKNSSASALFQLTVLILECILVRIDLTKFRTMNYLEIVYSLMIVYLFLKVSPVKILKEHYVFSRVLILGNFSYELYLIHYGFIIPLYLESSFYFGSKSILATLLLISTLCVLAILLSGYIYKVGSNPTSLFLRNKWNL